MAVFHLWIGVYPIHRSSLGAFLAINPLPHHLSWILLPWVLSILLRYITTWAATELGYFCQHSVKAFVTEIWVAEWGGLLACIHYQTGPVVLRSATRDKKLSQLSLRLFDISLALLLGCSFFHLYILWHNCKESSKRNSWSYSPAILHFSWQGFLCRVWLHLDFLTLYGSQIFWIFSDTPLR